MEEDRLFEKTLTETDINSKFVALIDWLGPLLPPPSDLNPGAKKEVLVVDESGKEYTFRLTVRSLDLNAMQAYHPKPEFMAKEWKAFVAEKGLKVGDRVWFWWDRTKSSSHLRVKVRVPPRRFTIFKNTFWC